MHEKGQEATSANLAFYLLIHCILHIAVEAWQRTRLQKTIWYSFQVFFGSRVLAMHKN